MKALIICAAFLVSSSALAAGSGCKEQPEVTGKCWDGHGRLWLTGDNGVMLATDKSKQRGYRGYAVVGEHDMPTTLYGIFKHDLLAGVDGKFEVCPLQGKDRFGDPQICIESASDIVVTPGRDNRP